MIIVKKSKRSLQLAAAAGILFWGDQPIRGIEPTHITTFRVTGNQGTLEWAGGVPGYQVQRRSRITTDWINVGAPTTNTSATVSLSGEQDFFRVVSDYTARYQAVFEATWSQATHPVGWPANAHWSGLVGGVHNSNVHFFRVGEPSSEGIRLMAERGQQATLLAEVGVAMSKGDADFQLAGGGIGVSPGSRSLVFPQPVRRDYPVVTLCSMVAPSPDWFVGVESLSLIEDGQWVPNKVVTVYALDAGTDSGPDFVSPDQVTLPRGVVTQFTEYPALQAGVVVPFGTFTFTRLP